MASVLAQEEVDALLQGVASDDLGIEEEDDEEYDPTEVVPFDLTAQDRIIRGRMPTLEIIHDRFVRLFRLTLSNALRKVVDISVRSTELPTIHADPVDRILIATAEARLTDSTGRLYAHATSICLILRDEG